MYFSSMQIFGKSSIEGKANGLGWINYRIEKISEMFYDILWQGAELGDN